MAIPPKALITSTLLSPRSIKSLSAVDWDLLIRQGRRSNLLARLAYVLDASDLLSGVPQAPRNHLDSALKIADRQAIAVRWEVECIVDALCNAEVKVTLLKGAAYRMAGLDAANGRTFSDVDIIVPKDRLDATEVGLMVHGWQASHHDAYDQRYYRQWMHEIPPLVHNTRDTTIDVHHSILPETARVKVNIAAVLDAVVPLPGHENLHVLQPIDMLLHSATHLFHEGELENGLRDLFDLHALIREFSAADGGFWDQLVPRAQTLGLTRPLYYALRYTRLMLDLQVPQHVRDAADIGRPSPFVLALMDSCYLRALQPMHPSTNSSSTRIARFALYVRSHWIRMPVHLLAYHLTRKYFTPANPQNEETPIADADRKA
ncbi:MAG: nucleotidyltransferase family protein [Rhodoferax sp.]|nr:nucleotidyltransferase family protein [Rhodoferax sp.]